MPRCNEGKHIPELIPLIGRANAWFLACELCGEVLVKAEDMERLTREYRSATREASRRGPPPPEPPPDPRP